MPRIAVKMKLRNGFEEEYQQRHHAIWPELQQLLKNYGISAYSIFLEPGTNNLFGVLEINDPAVLEALPGNPVMQRWWLYMEDIMETNADHSPVQIPLKEVFYLH